MDTKLLAVLREALTLAESKLGSRVICVAGGAVRDAYLGRPIKDIDVWFYVRSAPDFLNVVQRVGLEVEHLSYDEANAQLLGTVVIGEIAGLPVQAVAVPEDRGTVDGVLGAFDIGLCRIAFDGDLAITPAFLKDAAHKTLTVYPPFTKETAEKHIGRIREKYPEFRVVEA